MKDAAKKDRRKVSKKRNLEQIKQNLEQAKVNGYKFQIKIWSDILKKIESENANNKD